MFKMDQLMSAAFLLALLLYLVPIAFRLGETRRWFRRGAVLARGCYSNRGDGERDMVYPLTQADPGAQFARRFVAACSSLHALPLVRSWSRIACLQDSGRARFKA